MAYGSSYRGFSRVVPVGPFSRGRTVYASLPPRKRPRSGAPVRQGRRVRRRTRVASQTQVRAPKTKWNKVNKHGDNSSFSSTRVGARWSPQMRRLYRMVLGRQMVSKHQWASATSGVGTQDCSEFRYLEKSDLDSMVTVANGGVATDASHRIFIGSITAKYYFKNQSNAVGKLMIYDVFYKRHTATTALDSGRELWSKGFADIGTGAITRVGATPSQSSEFRTYCWIKRVTSVDLEPGQQHTHVMHRALNRVFDSSVWANNVGQSVAWITGSCMFVWHGSIVHESAAPGTVTFCDMRIDVVGSLEYSFGYLNKNTPTYTIQATMPSAIVDPDFMGESGDVDTNNNNA